MFDLAVTFTLTLRPSKCNLFIGRLNYIINQFGKIPSTGLLDNVLKQDRHPDGRMRGSMHYGQTTQKHASVTPISDTGGGIITN